MTLDPSTLRDAVAAATSAAKAAADGPIMSLFRSPALRVETKDDASPVSEADKAAEEVIREHLGARFPDIPVFGEEGGYDGPADSPLRWVVDPIDGTIAFIRGVPLFGTIIALEEIATGETLAGVIHLPGLGETYAAAKGQGCTCNGDVVRVTDGSASGPRLVSAGDRAWFEEAGVADAHDKLTASTPFLRGYTDCFGHAMVLRGAVSVMVDPGLAPWDLAATRVLVPEAGGRFWSRPSALPGKVDAMLGSDAAVGEVLASLGWS
ncbi:MAG: histidinol phosphate phosphatase [Proteobacteria bacterium]|nr:histidinol phosphate phosphatase [Pseudomonadota bacterium]